MSDGDEEPTASDASEASAPEESEASPDESVEDENAETGGDGSSNASDEESSGGEEVEDSSSGETGDSDGAPDDGEEDTEADEDGAGEDEAGESGAEEIERPEERERYEALLERLDDAADALEAAETEDDLDEVESTLTSIDADIDDAAFTPLEDLVSGDEDEDEEAIADLLDFEEELRNELQDLQDELEEQRGPYAEDVVAEIESAASTIESTRWTETGDGQIAEAVDSFVASIDGTLDVEVAGAGVEALEAAGEAVTDADLDADDDAETIASLLETTDELQSDVDDAQAFDDLTSRQKLQYEGFYDVLGKHKDFPPEWSAVKEWTQRQNAEMVALCMEHFGESEFMEEHCLRAFVRMGTPDAIEALKPKAQRRNLLAIEALGKTGHPDAVEGVASYIDSDSNPKLQTTAIRAIGELGATEHTEDVAQWLQAENEGVRSQAARSLGLLGDTRAIDPLCDVLADGEESESVRASAAWALYQIGTAEALEAAASHADERSYLVQSEAERANAALD